MDGLAETDPVWDQRCGVAYKAWVQHRYHRRRQRFWDVADKGTKALTVALGISLIGDTVRAGFPWVAASVTLLGLLALVFGYGDRKQLHKELAEQAANLVASIEQVPAGELTPGKVSAWSAEYLRLCMKAPPPLKTLTMMCEREQSAADGHPDHVALQPLWRRVLCHFY
jgi:hypothetical protein